MVLNSAVIELKELYDFVKEDKNNEAIKGDSKLGREFGKRVKSLTNSISENGGFYIWGSYTNKGLWNNIYLGKAGFGKTTGLQSRIKEELKDERPFFWKIKLTENQIKDKCPELYPKMAEKYTAEWDRSFRKFNSTHIIWVAINESSKVEFEKDILTIESDLIETMNPIANRSRPKPYGELQNTTIEIIRAIKLRIHENRLDKSFIPKEKIK
jgi:hypothetical protein